jgi:hypothetical protein
MNKFLAMKLKASCDSTKREDILKVQTDIKNTTGIDSTS